MTDYDNDRWRVVSGRVGGGLSAAACKEKALELEETERLLRAEEREQERAGESSGAEEEEEGKGEEDAAAETEMGAARE